VETFFVLLPGAPGCTIGAAGCFGCWANALDTARESKTAARRLQKAMRQYTSGDLLGSNGGL
jgi:hypothetical protein